MKSRRRLRALLLAVLGCAVLAVAPGAGAESAAASAADASASLEADVLAPFRQQLDALAAKSAAHKQAIDSGAAHELAAGPGFGADMANRRLREQGFDYPPGWVMRIVRPFESDYYTTQFSEHELLGWSWVEGAEGREALIRYRESLMLKAVDSMEAIRTDAWQPWLSVEHRLRAVRTAEGWQVEEAPTPTPTPGATRKRNLYDVPTVPTPGS